MCVCVGGGGGEERLPKAEYLKEKIGRQQQPHSLAARDLLAHVTPSYPLYTPCVCVCVCVFGGGGGLPGQNT